MKKGFTLMELMAVIIVIGLITLITFPIITNNLKKSEERSYALVLNQIETAAKDMMLKNTIGLDKDGESITIYVGELKRNGLLPTELKNPKSKNNISNESSVVVTRVNNSYTYDINIIDLEEASVQNENAPYIRLNGSYIEYVEINTDYIELGANAFSKDGDVLELQRPQIKLGEKEVSSINTSSLNTYKVIYSVTDNGITSTSIRTVTIRDTIKPIIIVPEVSTLKVSEVNGFDVKSGVYALDNSNETIDVQVVSTLSNLPGKYVIEYKAIDSSKNETVLRRIITVVED
ncbi:MAG: prepilin-type N-terminal cleavage/methylation domain-containing protein [Clostridium sp.]|nr:prepilin-type N-terminal cleavage/methylation domain-containing protein [Clostridium sp.]MCM1444734.1 prepilin-type N-terminal cleavage/methylation domain-containing protein [Candidatus Amulumruptor caecigallinarius]